MSESSGLLLNHFIVLDTQNSSSDYSLVTMEKPNTFSYAAGQCISIGFPDMAEDEPRMFSIASSTTEDVIILLVKHGISEYKQRLLAVKPNDELLASEPLGGFEFNNQTPVIFIAGGMGIAPFRSIVKYLLDTKCEQRLLLIHLHPTSLSPFADEFTEWQKQHKSFRFIALTNNDKHSDLEELLRQQQLEFGLENPIFYLAGPPEMVASCRQALEEIGVDPTQVRVDSQSAMTPAGR